MLDNIKKAKEELIKVKHFFKETYNKHIIYMYITVALLVNLIIEMLARGSPKRNFLSYFKPICFYM